ncbi:hypothetical protein [Nostoc sp.]|uniref:hypothetical protein n=1 Tax=Nostoc sp. TaxID=1180 RepID=UPI002FF88401
MVNTPNLLRFIANVSLARFIIPKLMMEVSSAKNLVKIKYALPETLCRENSF